MSLFVRRQFLKWFGAGIGILLAGSPFKWLRFLKSSRADTVPFNVYVAYNGTPTMNVAGVLQLAGGITRFIDRDDIVVLNPNGQWPKQGYTNTECMKALIDIILNRPGGFSGEIIIAEHVHFSPARALGDDCCWNMAAGTNRINNWQDMNYFELVDHFHNNGHPNVNAIPLYDSNQAPDHWAAVTGPADIPEGKHGWVRTTYTTNTNGATVRLSHAILRSPYSGMLVDLKHGVWENGGYNGRQVKLIFLPTLNNHSRYNHEDYAGPTSAVKCHLGIVEFAGPSGTYNLHHIGYDSHDNPDAVGESVGQLITEILTPVFYMTCAEYTGYRGRTTSTAAHTKTVGLCTDPVTLDYWMCKYVMYPIAPSQTFMNPDNDNNLRKTLLGCHSKGVGTLDESKMMVLKKDMMDPGPGGSTKPGSIVPLIKPLILNS